MELPSVRNKHRNDTIPSPRRRQRLARASLLLLAALLFALGTACSDEPTIYPDTGIKPDFQLPKDSAVPDTISSLKPGIIGQHSALAAVKGTLVASAYERQYGDLIYVTASTTNLSSLNKEIVDGVPKDAATHDPKGWRSGVSNVGDDVGLFTDIAATSKGEPYISYHDNTNHQLKFAVRSSSGWQVHVVDKPKTTKSKEVVGLYTSMVLNTTDAPAIAYLVTGVSAGSGNFKSELRWAQATKSSPTTAGDWVISKVETRAMPCRNLCESTEACIVNTDKTSTCKTTSTKCSSSCGTGKACIAGKCVDALDDSKLVELPMASGLFVSALNVSTGPMVVYYDRVGGNLRAALRAGGKWSAVVLKGTAKDDVGAYCSAAADKAGTVHVSYQDFNKGTLHYLQLTPPTLKATVSEVIDNGKRTTGLHLLGADSNLFVDPSGTVRVLYQDQQTVDLLGVRRGGANSWLPNTAGDKNLGRLVKGGAKGYGYYPDMVLDGGKVYGSNLYYDSKALPEGGLEFFQVK